MARAVAALAIVAVILAAAACGRGDASLATRTTEPETPQPTVQPMPPDWYFTVGTFESADAAAAGLADAVAKGYTDARVVRLRDLAVPAGCQGRVDPATGENTSFCGYPSTTAGFVVVLIGPLVDDPPRGTPELDQWHTETRERLAAEARERGIAADGLTFAVEFLDVRTPR